VTRALTGLAVVVAGVLVALRLDGPVSGPRLATAVSEAAGAVAAPALDACTRRDARTWDCSVSDTSGSGRTDYRVRVRPGSSCWTADRSAADGFEGEMPERLEGCVRRWQPRLP
jgi:hypothetical protein